MFTEADHHLSAGLQLSPARWSCSTIGWASRAVHGLSGTTGTTSPLAIGFLLVDEAFAAGADRSSRSTTG